MIDTKNATKCPFKQSENVMVKLNTDKIMLNKI